MRVVNIIIACLCMCFLLVGCENNNVTTVETENIKEENKVVQNTSIESEELYELDDGMSKEELKQRKMADTWMSMPENINLEWKSEEKANSNNYEICQEYKRGNDTMSYTYRVDNGVASYPGHNGIANEYYFYHYKGDYKWPSYVYFHDQYWDNWYFAGNYPSSPQAFCFGKPWEILDKYSDEHETVEIEGVGKVDTVKGTADDGYTYYYSKDLNINVKIENNVQIWSLKKYDTKPTGGYPHELPDMKALDAKLEAEKKAAEEKKANQTTPEVQDTTPDYYEDENGDVIIMDE